MLESLFQLKVPATEKDKMVDELQQINQKIIAVRREFELVDDHHLIEGLIFELKSLTQRQGYLYEKLKEEMN